MRNGVHIPSIDAKDIFTANSCRNDHRGYTLKKSDGEYNLRKFINTLDYSLDLIQLRKIYSKHMRRKNFGFYSQGKEYSTQVINLTFKYIVRDFNKLPNGTWVKFGYDPERIDLHDSIAIDEQNRVIAVKTDEQCDANDKVDMGEYFAYTDGCYRLIKQPKTIKTRSELRTLLYKNGFWCDGIHYVRLKRSSGSARTGKCLFINEALYPAMHKWEMCGLRIDTDNPVDLAALEAYISLTSSSIIDTINISPENILITEDYESVFKEKAIATEVVKGHLKSSEKIVEISNSIWDGESLLDESMFGDYSQYGMILLRNKFFKSCCFNCRIQKWFSDNGIKDVSQLNGFTLAKHIGDIKLITTPSSIKYLKFGTAEEWLSNIGGMFGIVKHDKKTHFFDGEMVQTHYQLLNTLQLSTDEMREFLRPSFEFAQTMRSSPAAVRYYIKYPAEKDLSQKPLMSKNDVVFELMCINDVFTKTKYYQDFLQDLLRSFYKNLKNGHVLVDGNYSTLLGNPVELLQQAVGKFKGESVLGIGNVYSKRFPFGQKILCSRSPHINAGNILLANNIECPLIDEYFNLTEEIICINSIDENILQRLNGADFDSDTMMITDNPILISAAERNYKRFLTPTSLVSAKKTVRYYTPEHQADLDIKTSVNKIGEIVNLSQVLNSLYWDNISMGQTHEQNHLLYCDICTLAVMSGIEIDKAKKEYKVNAVKELNLIRGKYADKLTDRHKNKKILPYFFAHISRQKGYYDPAHKDYKKHNTSMDYLQMTVNGFRTKRCKSAEIEPFTVILAKDKYRASNVNYEQKDSVISHMNDYAAKVHSLYDCDYDKDERHILYMLYKDDIINYITKQQIGYSTMYELLNDLYKRDLKLFDLLLKLLMTTANKSFFIAMSDSGGNVEYAVRGDGDIEMYGKKFTRVIKNRTRAS